MHASFNPHLFNPIKLGTIELKHRVVMPPLSRLRAEWPSAKPSALMVEHYSQRASVGGLIIAEMTAVSPEGRAYHTGPGLYSNEQVLAWKTLTDAVHAKGGSIFVQLSHAGRATHQSIGGHQPVAPSVNPAFWDDETIVVSTPDGFALPSPHRELEQRDIEYIVESYRRAAGNARLAGFDGVEVMAGNGHLVEQFLQNGVNRRKDSYGGSFENRQRFLSEVIGAISTVWPLDRIGVRVSPSSTFSAMSDSDPIALFRDIAQRLGKTGVGYLHIIEPRVRGADTIAQDQDAVATKDLKSLFGGVVIAAGGFTPESAERMIAEGNADLVAFGRQFTSNPDLPERIKHSYPLTQYDRNTFYAFDARGYTDYTPYEQDVIPISSVS